MNNQPHEYNPALDGPIRTSFDGPKMRPIPDDDGVWYRKFQTWTDRDGKHVGVWRWSREPY